MSAGGTWTRPAQCRPPRARCAGAGRHRHRRHHAKRRPVAHQGRQPHRGQPARHLRTGDLPGLRAYDDTRALASLLEAVNPGFDAERGRARRGPRRGCGRRRHIVLPQHRLSAVRRHAEARHRLLRRKCTQRACRASLFTDRQRRGAFGGRLVANGFLRLPIRAPRPRRHPVASSTGAALAATIGRRESGRGLLADSHAETDELSTDDLRSPTPREARTPSRNARMFAITRSML